MLVIALLIALVVVCIHNLLLQARTPKRDQNIYLQYDEVGDVELIVNGEHSTWVWCKATAHDDLKGYLSILNLRKSDIKPYSEV